MWAAWGHIHWIQHRSDDGLRFLAESWAIDLPNGNDDLVFAMLISPCPRIIQPSLLRFSDRQSEVSQFFVMLQFLMVCAHIFPERDAEAAPRRKHDRERRRTLNILDTLTTKMVPGSCFLDSVPQSNVAHHDCSLKTGVVHNTCTHYTQGLVRRGSQSCLRPLGLAHTSHLATGF